MAAAHVRFPDGFIDGALILEIFNRGLQELYERSVQLEGLASDESSRKRFVLF